MAELYDQDKGHEAAWENFTKSRLVSERSEYQGKHFSKNQVELRILFWVILFDLLLVAVGIMIGRLM